MGLRNDFNQSENQIKCFQDKYAYPNTVFVQNWGSTFSEIWTELMSHNLCYEVKLWTF